MGCNCGGGGSGRTMTYRGGQTVHKGGKGQVFVAVFPDGTQRSYLTWVEASAATAARGGNWFGPVDQTGNPDPEPASAPTTEPTTEPAGETSGEQAPDGKPEPVPAP